MSVCLHPMIASQLSQVSRSSRLVVSWLAISTPLPSGLGAVMSVDYFGPPPFTPQGIKDVLLLTNVFIDQCIPLRACPSNYLSRTTASSSAHRFRPLCPSFLAFRKVTTPHQRQRRRGARGSHDGEKKWLWPSLSAKMTGRRNFLMLNSCTQVRSAPPAV